MQFNILLVLTVPIDLCVIYDRFITVIYYVLQNGVFLETWKISTITPMLGVTNTKNGEYRHIGQ